MNATPDSPAIRSALLHLAPSAPARPALLERVLAEQQSLTAAARFAREHDTGGLPAQAKYYRDLIPMNVPGPGQQYAFEVDLDACTGCKACVAACHRLNGLEAGESWRTVGLLHGGTAEAPAQHTVTTSCHHCVDPGCMKGCPVKAYEKDPTTGIVRHLDDQCIGCQYCLLMCPYDAPKYSHDKGIVRKCDMCSDRLSAGEAPACVQACPSQAIRIQVIDQTQAIEASEAGTFLPGSPAPDHTIPTTVYKSARVTPPNMLPADFYAMSPEAPHLPLVVMLVLTQLAVGAFVLDFLAERFFGVAPAAGQGLAQAAFALLFAAGALGAATLHLGRPRYAFRAFLGFRTSWMSREIIAFGLFAKLGLLYALALAAPWLPHVPGLSLLAGWREPLRAATAATGAAGVLCSVLIYGATRRPHFRTSIVGFKFLATSVLLGSAALPVVAALARAAGQAPALAGPVFAGAALAGPILGDPALVGPALRGAVVLQWLLGLTIATAAAKLVFEASVLRHLGERRHTPMKRVAILMTRDLATATFWRFTTGLGGGVAIPAILLVTAGSATATTGALPAAPLAVAFLLVLAGEMLERYLFFRAAPGSRMPGAVA